MSRIQATKRWQGQAVIDELAARGILIRSTSLRGIAEEAPGAYKDAGSTAVAQSYPALDATTGGKNQATFTSTRRGCRCSAFGIRSFSTP
jgi:hypothetical protein